MAETNFNTRILLKYDSYDNWSAIKDSFVPKRGEVCFVEVPAETGAVQQEPAILFKVGDGTKTFGALPWGSGAAADVYDWAKAATKPEYKASEITGLTDYISGQIQDTDTQYRIVKVNDYEYKLQFKAKGASDDTFTDVPNGVIVIPSYDDTQVKGDIEALENLVGSTAVATQIGNAIAALDLANTYEAKGEAAKAQKAVEDYIGTIPDGYDEKTVVAYINKKAEETLSAASGGSTESAASVLAALNTYKAENDPKVNANTEAIEALEKDSHTHDNAEVLNGITAEKVAEWDAKQTAGDYATKEEAQGYADAKDVAIQAAQKAGDDARDAVDALADKVGEVPADKTVVEMISEAQTAATYDDTQVKADIKANADALGVLNGTGEGSVDKKITDAFNDFSTKVTDDAVVNSYKELIDWASDHGPEAVEMAGAITAIQNILAGIGGTDEPETVVAYVNAAIEALKIGDYAKASELTDLAGRVAAMEGKVANWDAAEQNAKDYADGLNNAMNGRMEAVEGKAHEHDNETVLDGITAEKVSAWDASEQNAKGYADQQIEALENDTLAGLRSDIDDATDAIDVLNGEATEEGSVAKKIADAIAAENLGQYAKDADLATVAKTGNVNDLIQADGDVIVFDCGSAIKNI